MKKALTEPVSCGCLNCGPKPITLALTRILAVGFGGVEVTKDGATIWSGDDVEKTLGEFEGMAMADPDHDWRVRFDAPLWNATYQRHGDRIWNLIEKGQGFA